MRIRDEQTFQKREFDRNAESSEELHGSSKGNSTTANEIHNEL